MKNTKLQLYIEGEGPNNTKRVHLLQFESVKHYKKYLEVKKEFFPNDVIKSYTGNIIPQQPMWN
jgi:hypothetical protein